MGKFCGYCGSALPESGKFCPNCGHPIPVQPQTPPVVQPTSQTNYSRPQYDPAPSLKKTTKPAPQPVEPKKKGGFGKVFIILVLLVVAAIGVEKYLGRGKEKEPAKNEKESAKKEKVQRNPLDDGPSIVLNGDNYKLELPGSATDVKCVPVSDKRMEELKRQGYNLITKPLLVTQNGNKHVQLNRMATVSFDIPKDFPREQYDELVGVLITDDGPEYRIPDYFALREGVLKFRTSHFSEASYERNKAKLREEYINYVAINGWQNSMSNKSLEPTWRQQLTKFADDHYLGEKNMLGIIGRELLSSNETATNLINIGSDFIDAHDMEDASLEQRIEVASGTIVSLTREKTLAYLFNKLKEDETRKKKVIDEMKSDPKGETRYKTEIIKIDSRRNKIVETLEKQFSIDNVEEVSTLLGEGPSVEKCFIYACDKVKEKSVDYLKSTTVALVPYVKTVQSAYHVMGIVKKYIANEEMTCYYKMYKKFADKNDGRVDPDEWDVLFRYFSAPETSYGMTEPQIKELFEKMYRDSLEINKKKADLGKLIDLIDDETTILTEYTSIKSIQKLDYSQRLTRTINLMERFRKELIEDGKVAIPAGKTSNSFLVEVVEEYLTYYPDQEAFYQWLARKGYYHNKLEDDFRKLDALLWKENDPEIHIVIRETLGAESGKAKYWGKTLCLGVNGKPFTGWHIDITGDDDLEYTGWEVEFPGEDANPVTLNEYKLVMGMPNQLLIYKNADDFKNGKAPMEVRDFVADTTGRTTEIELSKTKPDYVFSSFEGHYFYGEEYTCAAFNNAVADALGKFDITLQRSGNFSINSQGVGSCEINGVVLKAQTNVSLSGYIDKETGQGNFTLSVSGSNWSMADSYTEQNSYTVTGDITSKVKNGETNAIFDSTTSPLKVKRNGAGWDKAREDESLNGIKIVYLSTDKQ